MASSVYVPAAKTLWSSPDSCSEEPKVELLRTMTNDEPDDHILSVPLCVQVRTATSRPDSFSDNSALTDSTRWCSSTTPDTLMVLSSWMLRMV